MPDTLELRAAAENGQVIHVCPRQGGPCRPCIPGLVLTAALAALLAVLNRRFPPSPRPR